jgi:Secretion system C-terminal sorting domain/Putative binding domain, N-terminal
MKKLISNSFIHSFIHSFCLDNPPLVVSPFTRFISLSSLFLIASFLSVYDGLGQSSVKISLPLNRTVFQQSASNSVFPIPANSATFQLAGQVKDYFSSGTTTAVPEYKIEHLDPTGMFISIKENWTATNYSNTTGFFNKTITLSTGWYRISVRYNPFSSSSFTDAIKVGVGEVIFAAGQSNAQGVDNGQTPIVSNYDCINTVNQNCWCKKNYDFPVFSQMEYSATDGDKKVAPNGNQSLWCYQELGKNIVDRKSTSAVTTPVIFFNAGSGGTGIDNWKVSAEGNIDIITTKNPLQGIKNCELNDPNGIFPLWNSEGPEGHPYRGLKTALNFYGGILGTRGIIWHQGESETKLRSETTNQESIDAASDYQGKLQFLINKTRVDYNDNLSWAISRVSRIKLTTLQPIDNSNTDVQNDQAAVKNAGNGSGKMTWGAYYSDRIGDDDRLPDKTHFNRTGLEKLAQLYDTGNFTGNVLASGETAQGGDILSLTPVEFNSRSSLALNVTRPTTSEITMTVSGVYSAYRWVKNEGKITDSPTDKWTQSITVNNTGTDRWRCYVLDSKGNVAITQEVALPVREALILGPGECPSGTFNPLADKITCDEISGWMFRSNSNGEFGKVDIYVDGQFKNRISANSTKQYGTLANNEGYIYNVPIDASWRNGVNHVVSVRQCNYNIDFASTTLNCPAYTDINITDKTGLTDVSNAGGTGSFVVNSTNANWSLSTGGASWVTVSPNSGLNGATAVSVTFQSNSGAARNATLTINDSNAGVTRYVDISQQGTGGGLPPCQCGFTLITANQNAGQYSGSYTFNSCNASMHKWKLFDGVTEIANSGTTAYSVNSSTVSFSVPTSVNTGNYQFRVDADNCTGTGTQPFSYTKPNGGNNLSLSQSTWSPSSSAGTQGVNVTSNIAWSVSTSDGSWLTTSTSSGSNNGSFTISATANGSTASRSGTITVSGSGVSSQTVSVTQAGTSGGSPIDRTEGGTASDDNASNPGGEDETKAFDNQHGTKWLVFNSIGKIDYDFAGNDAYAINSYTVTTANDAPNRDPKNWTLQGSDSGSGGWVDLDSRSDQFENAPRFHTITYSLNNTTAYKHYRLNVTANRGDIYLQIAEIQMFGPAGTGGGGCPTYTEGQIVVYDSNTNENFFAHFSGSGTLYATPDGLGLFPPATRQRLINAGLSATVANCFADGTTGGRIATTEEEIPEKIMVYPNPTTGKIKIVFSLQKSENVWLNLYDTQGKSLDLRDFEGKAGRNEMEYDLQNYSSGTYFVNFQSSEKREVLKVTKVN